MRELRTLGSVRGALSNGRPYRDRAPSAWLRANWALVAPLVQGTGTTAATVVGLIVTRRPVPLSLLGACPGAALEEVEDIGRHVIGTPIHSWRADLQRGVAGGADSWTG